MTTHPDTLHIDAGDDTSTEDTAINRVIQRMQSRFPTTDPDHVRDVVLEHHRRLEPAPLRIYVPVLVEHAARKALTTAGPRSA